MSRPTKTHEHCGLGPVIPIVSARDFDRKRLPKSAYEDAWSIVGPTIHRNHDRPVWQLLAIAYLQGLQHGAALGTSGGDTP